MILNESGILKKRMPIEMVKILVRSLQNDHVGKSCGRCETKTVCRMHHLVSSLVNL